MNATKSMPDPFVTRHLGHITYQGPESEAPNWSLPIDLPACDDQEGPISVFDAYDDPAATVRKLDAYEEGLRDGWDLALESPQLFPRDLIYVVFGAVGTAIGGLIALWMLK